MTRHAALLIGTAVVFVYGALGESPQGEDSQDNRELDTVSKEHTNGRQRLDVGGASRKPMGNSYEDGYLAPRLESSGTNRVPSTTALQDLEFDTLDPGWDYVDMDDGPPVEIGYYLDPDNPDAFSPYFAANTPIEIGFYLDPDDTFSSIGSSIGADAPVDFGVYLDPDAPPEDDLAATPVYVGTYLDPDFPGGG